MTKKRVISCGINVYPAMFGTITPATLVNNHMMTVALDAANKTVTPSYKILFQIKFTPCVMDIPVGSLWFTVVYFKIMLPEIFRIKAKTLSKLMK